MASQKSQGSQVIKVSSQELDTMINETVQYILSQDYAKYPIKRPDIVKNVLKGNGKIFKHIIEQSKIMFKEIFGMDLVESDHPSSLKQYILVNNAEFKLDVRELQWSSEEESQQVLLMLVLSLIFMNGGVVKEADMWQFLKGLEIPIASKSHEYFGGDVRKLMTLEFVRQAYLEHNRVPNTDPPQHEFRWGWRAEAEVSRRSLLDFVSKVHGDCNPTNWTSQYKEMLTKEEKMNDEQNYN